MVSATIHTDAKTKHSYSYSIVPSRSDRMRYCVDVDDRHTHNDDDVEDDDDDDRRT